MSSISVWDNGQFGSQKWLGDRSRKTDTLCVTENLFTRDTRATAELQQTYIELSVHDFELCPTGRV